MSTRRGSTSTTPPQIVPIDVDSIDDDDVILSSPRSFAEAKNNSRRNRSGGVEVVDLDAERPFSRSNNSNTRSRLPRNQQVINCESYVNSKSRSSNLERQKPVAPPPPPPPPPPPEPVFSCPVCMGPLVEEMSTKCGHIFCKTCITSAIAAQKKCPTCRRKMTMKDTFRVFLPTAN